MKVNAKLCINDINKTADQIIIKLIFFQNFSEARRQTLRFVFVPQYIYHFTII